MAFVPEQSIYEEGVYQFETTDPVQGGLNGIDNLPSKHLANRTKYLKEHVDALENGTGFQDGAVGRVKLAYNAITSGKRNCILSGPVSGSTGLEDTLSRTSTTTVLVNGSPTPIRLSFAAGYDDQGPVDIFGKINADVTVTINQAGTGDVYIYGERTLGNSAVTVAGTSGQVIFSTRQPSGVAAGTLWFDKLNFIWKRLFIVGSVQQWNDAYIVLLGRVTRLSNGNIDGLYTYGFLESVGSDDVMPTGTVIAVSTDYTEAPDGFLHCDGGYISITAYNRLFAVIGNTYGAPIVQNGELKFKLPDLRGEFIRGLDAGRGVDTGRTLGSSQGHQLQDHSHVFRFAPNAPGSGGTTISASAGAVDSVGQFINAAINANVGAETRPRNVAIPYFIKY